MNKQQIKKYEEDLLKRGYSETDFDDLVHDLALQEATNINNGGMAAQLYYILNQHNMSKKQLEEFL